MKRALVFLALCTALLAGGCGGNDEAEPLTKDEYVTEMQTIGRQLNSALEALGTATSADAAATALGQAQEDLDAAADQMEALAAPEDVADEHAALATAVRNFGEELGPLADKLEGGGEAELAEVQSGIPQLEAYNELVTAATAISNKGYEIGGS